MLFSKKHVGLLLIVLITSTLFLNGCLRTYYPLVYGTNASPMVFENPSSYGILKNDVGVDFTTSEGFYGGENLTYLQGAVNYVQTQKYTNFNSKFFGYIGKYRVNDVYSYSYDGNNEIHTVNNWNGSKIGFGFGGEGKFAVNFKFGAFKLGLGTTVGVGTEFGEYYNFRKNAKAEGAISSSSDDTRYLFYANIFNFLVYEYSEETNISLQTNIGFPGFISPSISLNNNNNFYWISIIPNRIAVGCYMSIENIFF
jgi:hypothetical protein